MTQEAVLTKLLPNQMAEVAVTRSTACGGNCGSCESCMFQNQLKTVARNLVGARPGQRVCIETRSGTIYSAALLVYIVPLLFMLAAYAAAALLHFSEPVRVLCCFLALIPGAAIIILSQRRKGRKEIRFDIIDIL